MCGSEGGVGLLVWAVIFLEGLWGGGVGGLFTL